MDIVYNDAKNCCRNMFATDLSELQKNFTNLWIKVICEKEDGLVERNNMHTRHFRV